MHNKEDRCGKDEVLGVFNRVRSKIDVVKNDGDDT
jgi:hypothetical protein